MPAGACVIRRDGKKGTTWAIKFVDASGHQVQETLGRASDGWNRRKADAALRARLTDVQREGYRRPERVTFQSFACEWLDDLDTKGLKQSTTDGYATIVTLHLIPAFGSLGLSEVTVERVERLIASKLRDGKKGGTVNRIVNVLSLILWAAQKRSLVHGNAVSLCDRPREARRRWRILSPAEIRAVERAYDDLIAEASDEAGRTHRETCLAVFRVTYGLGLRRGELLGLRWRHVRLADPDGPTIRIEETFVRGRTTTPKSERSTRTLALGPRLAEVLFEHRARSAYSGDDEYVFTSRTGRPFDPATYGNTFKLALERAGIKDRVRPFHDGRHSSITNGAAAGIAPAALMARAGHASFATTTRYINLAGQVFRDEAEMLERRLWGETGTKNRYEIADPAPTEETA